MYICTLAKLQYIILSKSTFFPAYLLTFVNTLGFSILIPVLPFIVEKYNAPEYVYGLILSLYAFFQFLGAPFLGGLSDRIGRKPVLLISQIGTLLSWFIFAIAYFVPSDIEFIYALPIWIIILARILDGLTGGNISATNAYISDVTTKKQKSVIFGYLGGIAGLGIIIGPGIGGVAAGGPISWLGTILIALSISLLTVFAIQFMLKESLPINKRRQKSKFNLLTTLLVTKRIKELNPTSFIKKVFLLRLIMGVIMASYIGTVALYIKDLFLFNEQEVGFFMLFVGAYLAINQAFLYKIVVKKLGELKTMVLGFALMMIGFVLITIKVDIVFYMMLYFVLNLGFSLVLPVFNSLISQYGEASKQGEAMGISESINSLCMAIFPILAVLLFTKIDYQIYYILGLVPLIGIFIIFRILKESKNEQPVIKSGILEQSI